MLQKLRHPVLFFYHTDPDSNSIIWQKCWCGYDPLNKNECALYTIEEKIVSVKIVLFFRLFCVTVPKRTPKKMDSKHCS